MPKFEIARTTHYVQRDTLTIEADDALAAFALAREEQDPEFDWEQVERAHRHDTLQMARKGPWGDRSRA